MTLSYEEKMAKAIPMDHLADVIATDKELQFYVSKLEKERVPGKAKLKAFLRDTGYQYGTVNGKLAYHVVPQNKVAVQKLIAENPELVEPYMVEKTIEVLDLEALRQDYPELVGKYDSWTSGHEK